MSIPSDPESKPQKRNKKADLFYSMAVAMLRGKSGLPDFPTRFEVLQDDQGVRHPIIVSDLDVCHTVHPSFVEGEILRYFMATKYAITINLNPSDMRQIYTAFMALAKPIAEDDIKPLLQRSTKGLTWNRLGFDLKTGPTPVYDEIMDRTKNANAFMAWIGSLLDPCADLQQYLWVHGSGMNGKSRVFNQLAKVLGPGYCPENVPKGDSRRFWTSGIIGKRLVVFNDCDDERFPVSGFFKNLSGGEPVRVEVKGGSSYKATLNAKFAFLSNDRPQVSGTRADRRRAVYVEMGPIQGQIIPTAEYDKMLAEENPAWFAKCYEVYKELAKGKMIPVDQEGLEDLISDAEEEIEAFVDEHIVFEADAQMKPYELLNLMKANDVKWTRDQRKIIRWMIRERGVQKVQNRPSRERVYVGLRGKGNVGEGY